MASEEALALLNKLIEGQKLKNIYELVFCYSWQELTYSETSKQIGYDTSDVRNIGQELWLQLSQAFNERVTKKSIYSILRRQLGQDQYAVLANLSEKNAENFSRRRR